VVGALATVLSTWLTADCAGEPGSGAGVEGASLEPARAGAELAAEPEDPDADAALELEVDVGADEPAEEGELGADGTLELDSDGPAELWVGELTAPVPGAPRPGAATRTAPEAARRPTRDSAKRGA
jgi:hypothetical protein